MATTGDVSCEEEGSGETDDVTNVITPGVCGDETSKGAGDVTNMDTPGVCGDVTSKTGDVSPSPENRQDVVHRAVLDESSAVSVLQGNSNITADSKREEYVSTPALEEADDILQKTGCVILCGPPGSGKTTMANALSRRSREQGFSLYNLEGLELWRSNVGEQERSIVVLDGIFGHVFVHTQQFNCWRNILKTVLEQIKLGMCRLVITVYPHVLRELQQLENHLDSPLKDYGAVVRLAHDLPTKVKEKLLNFHLNRVVVETDRKSQIVKDILEKDVSGPVFPWCCGYMVKKWSLSGDPTAVFSVPAEAYTQLLKDIVLDKTHEGVFAAVLTLAMRRVSHFLHNPSEATRHLDELGFEPYSNDTLAACADLLRGSILSGSTFSSRVLYEAVGLAVGRYFRFATLLKVCDVPFLVKYVHLTAKDTDVSEGRPCSACVTVGSVPSCSKDPEQCTKDLQALVERILKEVIQGNLQDICQQSCLQCPQFQRELESVCANNRKRVKQMLNAVDPVHKLPLVYWSLFLPSVDLAHWCLSRMQTSTRFFSLVLIACSLFDHLMQKSEVSHKALVYKMIAVKDFIYPACVMDFPFLEKEQRLTKEVQKRIETIMDIGSAQEKLLYLHDPALPIPPDLVKLQVTHDRLQLRVKDRRHWYLVFRLLSDTDVTETDQDGNSLLHIAVSCEQLTAVKLLLSAGAMITQQNKEGVTPYQLAHKKESFVSKDRTHNFMEQVVQSFPDMDQAVVQLFLLQKPNLNVRDRKGRTGLHVACHKGCRTIADVYIQLGADVTSTTLDGETALHFASLCPSHTASADITRLLLQTGAGINRQNDEGDTPLMYAARNGHSDTVELLIRQGADVNIGNTKGSTPLLCAASNDHTDVVKLLMHHGVDVNINSWPYRRYKFIFYLDDPSLAKANTALHLACKGGMVKTVERLIEHEADATAPTVKGHTALHFASVCPSPTASADITRLLIQTDADVNRRDGMGGTPILHASRKGYTGTVELLICHGADVNVQDIWNDTPLMRATFNGQLDTVKLLIFHSADVNKQNKQGDTPLLFAAMNGHTHTAELLIRDGADVNTQNDEGDTPLLRAVMRGHTHSAELLIRNGADVNTQNEEGDTPLLFAAMRGHTHSAELLIRSGADVNTRNDEGDTPLLLAAMRGHTHSAELLIRNGADVNTQNDEGDTPLLLAAMRGHTHSAELLIRNGADVNTQNENGKTPLLLAVMTGYSDTAELLIRSGADANTQNENGKTPLLLAVSEGHLDIVDLLIRLGADVSTQKEESNMPLVEAARKGHSDIAEMLISHGADVNMQSVLGDTPLRCTVRNGHIDTAELLIRHGADINTQGVCCDKLLRYAARNGHSDIAELLICHGADANKRSSEEDTTLLSAVRNGYTDIAELLIRHGVDINQQNEEGSTPVLCAAIKGQSDMVELLIRHGADIRRRNEEGDSPLLCAVRNGHSDTAEVLIRHKADVNAQHGDVDLPLLCAIRHGHSDIAELLIHHGANVNKGCKHDTPLLCALRNGHSDTAELLIHQRTNIMTQNGKGDSPLLAAARNGLSDTAALLIRQGADINTQDEKGDTPLLCATKNGVSDMAELLIHHGADVNKKDDDGGTPLLHAVRNGLSDLAEQLIHHGADVNGDNFSCRHYHHSLTFDDVPVAARTVLHWACKNGMVETVELLIQHEADVTASMKGLTALHFACLCTSHIASAGITRLIVQAGADVNRQDMKGDTPLLNAARNGHLDTAEVLIRHGADVNRQNTKGDTPLLNAARNGHLDTAEVLIRHGADVNRQNTKGDTPLLCAVLNDHLDTAELLVRHDANVNIRDRKGSTPILSASKKGYTDTAELLINHRAGVNTQNFERDTPLLCAVRNGHSDTAKLLIRHGAHVNVWDKTLSNTPLLLVARSGDSDTAELLIHDGADVNAQDDEGDPPLVWAVRNGHSDMAEMLISHGADIDRKNAEGDTPLICAVRNGLTDLAELLIRHDADVNIKHGKVDRIPHGGIGEDEDSWCVLS